MLPLSSIRYAITKFNPWNATKPIPKQIAIFFGREILFHQDRVFIAVVPQDTQ